VEIQRRMLAAARSRHAAQLAFDGAMGRTVHYPVKRKDDLTSLDEPRVRPADLCWVSLGPTDGDSSADEDPTEDLGQGVDA